MVDCQVSRASFPAILIARCVFYWNHHSVQSRGDDAVHVFFLFYFPRTAPTLLRRPFFQVFSGIPHRAAPGANASLSRLPFFPLSFLFSRCSSLLHPDTDGTPFARPLMLFPFPLFFLKTNEIAFPPPPHQFPH